MPSSLRSSTAVTRFGAPWRPIEECRFGIHDLSRIERDAVNDLPRFNMPFELGLFLGGRRYGPRPQRDKHCLVLEAERYRYQNFLSEIAGQDIRSHDNEPAKPVGAVRDWLASRRVPGQFAGDAARGRSGTGRVGVLRSG